MLWYFATQYCLTAFYFIHNTFQMSNQGPEGLKLSRLFSPFWSWELLVSPYNLYFSMKIVHKCYLT